MDCHPPVLTKSELETFLHKVKRWEESKTRLNHIWFEGDAFNYVQAHGYKFERFKDNKGHYYRAMKR